MRTIATVHEDLKVALSREWSDIIIADSTRSQHC